MIRGGGGGTGIRAAVALKVLAEGIAADALCAMVAALAGSNGSGVVRRTLICMQTVAALLKAAVGLSWESCEGLLDEPIAIDDPLITTAQVCRLTGAMPGEVDGLQRRGWLDAQKEAQAGRRYRLIDVLELLQPMTVDAAAVLIGCSPQRVTVNPAHPLRRLDAILQLARRRQVPEVRAAWPTPVVDPVPADMLLDDYNTRMPAVGSAVRPLIEPRPVEPLRLEPVVEVVGEPERWVDLVEAAGILGVSRRTAQRMAATDQLPAVKGLQGYLVQYGKLLLIRNARDARAAQARDSNRTRRSGQQPRS